MLVDRYTRGVLTLIAVALLWIALTLTFPTQSAQAAAANEPTEVNLMEINGKKVASRTTSQVDKKQALMVHVVE
jgi:hypothetical protein